MYLVKIGWLLFDLVVCGLLEFLFKFKYFSNQIKSVVICFLCGHCYACFGFLVTFPLGFKARVGSLICTWQSHTCYIFPDIHPWFNTS